MKHRKKWKSYIETIKSFLFIFSIVGLKPSYLTTTKKNRFFGGLEIHAFKRWRNLNLSLSPESPPFRRKERQQQQRHVFSFAWPIWDFFAKTVGVGMLGHFLRGSKRAPQIRQRSSGYNGSWLRKTVFGLMRRQETCAVNHV